MKKSLAIIAVLILLLVVFFGGARFNQYTVSRTASDSRDRQILHYVDPMNPEHTTKEPGIAPCGMPMEPVYAESSQGGSGTTASAVAGAVTINPHKQQIIGVRVGEVVKNKEIQHLRALGRIVADENRVYPLIASTDGWLEDISEATTGSLVSENQLLAQIKVYNYDFFTWQQRYLTELGYTNRISVSPSALSPTDQGRRRSSSGAGYQAGLPIPESDFRMIQRAAIIAQRHPGGQALAGMEPSPAAEEAMEPAPDQVEPMLPSPPPAESPPGSGLPAGRPAMDHRGDAHSAPTGPMTRKGDAGPDANRDRNLLYASKGRQELLNFGVEESQLQALVETGAYITHIDLRSPVNGYVLSRKVSPLQKIDRNTECFTIADLGKVWVEADIYDREARFLQPGTQARISLPGQEASLNATVTAILPRFDAPSRSLKVRLEMENPAYVLRPDMFVDVEFLLPLPESISVPATAVIDSGKRRLVYVVVADGIFQPRPVETGWRTNDRVEVVKGLQPGDRIVISGNFLIDAESRMKLAATKLMLDPVEQAPTASKSATAAAVDPQLEMPALPETITPQADTGSDRFPEEKGEVNPQKTTADHDGHHHD